MISGERYDATDEFLVSRLVEVRDILWEFNNLRPSQIEEQHEILRNLLGRVGQNFHFNQPFRCDYGCNIHIGDNFFANFNLTILDEAPVTIGDNAFIGPNVSIYTACHPIESDERNTGVEWAEPVIIGDNVWIGGNAVILPGVTIGDNCVIGAGSVVTKNVESGTVVGGNPAKFIKRINPDTGCSARNDDVEIIQRGLDRRGDISMIDYPFSITDLHTTHQGAERIRRNLGLGDTIDVINFCRCIILEDAAHFERKGKNWYVTAGHVKITVNAGSNTIITAHRV